MAKKSIYRGDSDSWSLSVPLSIWSAGGKFFFAVKSKDSIAAADTSDNQAVLKKTFDDTYITSTTTDNKVYTLKLLPSETQNTVPGKYKAEFQWVNSSALSNPSDANAIVKTFAPFDYTIVADINQRTS